ncbi:MAG: T9SS type A sorting domain-containing protein, partial [Bacteroidota bacterium]
WCEYDGDDDPIIVGRDEDCDGIPGDEDVWVIIRSNGITYYDRNNNENDTNPFRNTKQTSCDGLTNPDGHWVNSVIKPSIASVGYWQYTQQIKVYDNIDPVITFEATDPFCSLDNVDCDATVEVPFTVDENCTPDDITIKVFLDAFADGILDGQLSNAQVLSGMYPDYTINGEFPIGSHLFEVHVEDGCGNVNSVDIPFSVVDCKAPVPTCINGLAIELMPTEPGTDADGDGDIDTGAMGIWASDFIASPVGDCSEPIQFSINRDGETPDINQTGIILTCDDPATLIVEIYAWDSAFNPYAVQPDGTVGGPNYDHCETYILIQDNMFDVCTTEATGSIAGITATEWDDPIENTEVLVSGVMNEQVITGIDGAYSFPALPANEDYTVTPHNDLDPDNGVSTFDIVVIQKHILGVDRLDSPYQMIAADVDNSGSISVVDLLTIRKLVLSVIDEFPGNTSWRFVDAAYSFPDPQNPWVEQFPEVVSVNNLPAESIINGDFVGVKIGDVTGDAQSNSLQTIQTRSRDEWVIDVASTPVEVGQVRIPFSASDLADLQAYQFTLSVDAAYATIQEVEYGSASADHIGMRYAEEGTITLSWDEQSTLDTEATLFTLVLNVQQAAEMEQFIQLHSRYTKAEAYDQAGEAKDIALRFGESQVQKQYVLHQNRPNPFSDATVISFELPEELEATIIIRDVQGRTLRLIRGEYAKGYNEISLKASELGVSGVLYYTLETDDFTATRRMMILE